MSPLNHKRTTSSSVLPICYVTKICVNRKIEGSPFQTKTYLTVSKEIFDDKIYNIKDYKGYVKNFILKKNDFLAKKIIYHNKHARTRRKRSERIMMMENAIKSIQHILRIALRPFLQYHRIIEHRIKLLRTK